MILSTLIQRAIVYTPRCQISRWSNKFSRVAKRQPVSKDSKSQSELKPSDGESVQNLSEDHVCRSVKDLYKPLLFTVAFSGACFTGAALWQHERVESRRKFLLDKKNWRYEHGTMKHGRLRQKLNAFWQNATVGFKTFSCIAFANLLVYIAWRVPTFQPFMRRYFMCSFHGAKLCTPMFFSVFSHINALHLGVNMYVLYTFAPAVIDKLLGLEQFLAVYASSGCVSSFFSMAYKALSNSPKASVGASGAILALLTYTCCKIPDSRLSLVFLPSVTFNSQEAIVLILGLDLAGLLFRWKLFDHAAHLGGSIFGILYAWCGEDLWRRRNAVVDEYKKFSDPTFV